MPFIPHTPADVQAMLDAIGAPDIEALFDEIPDADVVMVENVRYPNLKPA